MSYMRREMNIGYWADRTYISWPTYWPKNNFIQVFDVENSIAHKVMVHSSGILEACPILAKCKY